MHAALRDDGHRIYSEIRDKNNWKNRGHGVFDIPSASEPGTLYLGVCVVPDEESCPCKLWRKKLRDKKRGHYPCKHHWAAYFELDALGQNPASLPIFQRGLAAIEKELKSKGGLKSKRVPLPGGKYAHLAPSTRANKRTEIWPSRGPEMLFDLCQIVREPARPLDLRGPKPRSAREQCFAMVLKELESKSLRGLQGHLKGFAAADIIKRAPSVNSMARYRADPKRVKDLFKMFWRTAACVSEIETEYAVDSTSFSCTRTGNYADSKYYRTPSKEAVAAARQLQAKQNGPKRALRAIVRKAKL
jgi:hypothetical protein